MTFAKSLRSYSLVALMLLMSAAALAQNVDNLTPYQTFVRTENSKLNLSGSWQDAFQSVQFTCPASHSAGCTVIVQVSSQFGDRNHCCDNKASKQVDKDCMMCNGWGNLSIKVGIPGSGSQVFPNSTIKVGTGGCCMGNGNNGLANAETFQWMKTGINAGDQETVSIQFETNNGNRFKGTAGYRTAVVHLDLN